MRPEWRDKLPAVTHVDGTARVQTVSRKTNPRYYRLIEEFKKLSGVGVVLNTSFNLKGEPMVLTPRQATHDFLRTEMDVLVLGDYVLEKGKLGDYRRERVFPQFHPVHDNIDLLGDGHYLILDLFSEHPLLDHDFFQLMRAAAFKNLSFTVLPFEKGSEWYAKHAQQMPVLKKILPLVTDFARLDLTGYLPVDGILILIPEKTYFYQCECEAELESLARLMLPVVRKNPDIKRFMMDAAGVVFSFDDFISAMAGVKQLADKMLVEESHLDVTESELYQSLMDMERRFKTKLRG